MGSVPLNQTSAQSPPLVFTYHQSINHSIRQSQLNLQLLTTTMHSGKFTRKEQKVTSRNLASIKPTTLQTDKKKHRINKTRPHDCRCKYGMQNPHQPRDLTAAVFYNWTTGFPCAHTGQFRPKWPMQALANNGETSYCPDVPIKKGHAQLQSNPTI